MKTKIYFLVLILLFAASLAPAARAQTLAVRSGEPRATVTVTFTFHGRADDYATFAGEDGEGRYYIQVPADNVPTYKLANAAPGLKVMVDNEKSNEERFVFWVPVRPGTAPRVERKDANLILTFIPPATASAPESAAAPPAPATQPAAAAAAAPRTPAQDAAATAIVLGKPIDTANADLAVPESPAFTVLGLTPETVVRPATPRAFVSSLLSGVDQHGNFQSGVALDATPYLIFAGKELTLRKYNSSQVTRLLARTQFSFANTKGASDDDKSVRLALGVHVTLWDRGDPHSDRTLLGCFAKGLVLLNLTSTDPNNPQGPSQAAIDAANAQNVAVGEKCREQARKDNWNRSSWIVAAAPSWISPTGETKNFQWNGGGFWTSLAYGFEGVPSLEKNSQLILHARYRNNEQVPDPDNEGKFIVQNSMFFGGRWRFGNENSTANVEGVFQRTRPKGEAWDSSARYSVGLERRVAENLWFAISFGGESGRTDGKNNGFVLSSFRWGFSQKRQLTVPGFAASSGTTP